MSATAWWLTAIFLLIIAGELAHVRLTDRHGISPIASAAGVTLMLSLPLSGGLLGSATVLAGAVAVGVAAMVGTAIAEAAGMATSGVDVVGRVSNALVTGVLALLIAMSGLERTMERDGRDWVYALAIWVAALGGAGARALVIAFWFSWSGRRAYRVALRDEMTAFGMLSFASATTAVMIVLAREAVGLWAPIFFLAPLVLSIAAARRYAHTRETYRETIVALSRLTDHTGHTTNDHARRVADLSVALARVRGLSQRELVTVEYAALLHDLGQVGLDEPIPGGATVLAAPRDQDRIAQDGVRIISHSGVLGSVAAILGRQATPFRSMREDDERIPLESRIIKLTNAFDDLTGGSRDPGVVSVALERIHLGLGYEYDPELVDELIDLVTSDRAALTGATERPVPGRRRGPRHWGE